MRSINQPSSLEVSLEHRHSGENHRDSLIIFRVAVGFGVIGRTTRLQVRKFQCRLLYITNVQYIFRTSLECSAISSTNFQKSGSPFSFISESAMSSLAKMAQIRGKTLTSFVSVDPILVLWTTRAADLSGQCHR